MDDFMNKHPHVVTISGVVYTITITVWLYATTICIVIPTVLQDELRSLATCFITFIFINGFGNLCLLLTQNSYYKGTSDTILPGAGWKHCNKCNMDAPPRSHHCQVCSSCVLKRDHHCFMVGTCIGERNHAHFLMFTSYCFLALSLATMVYFYYINAVYKIHPFGLNFIHFLPPVVFIEMLTGYCTLDYFNSVILFFISICCITPAFMLTTTQLVLIGRDQTTYEYTRGDAVKKSTLFQNFKKAFGRNFFLKPFLPLPYKHFY